VTATGVQLQELWPEMTEVKRVAAMAVAEWRGDLLRLG
jgi:hypothetical protein